MNPQAGWLNKIAGKVFGAPESHRDDSEQPADRPLPDLATVRERSATATGTLGSAPAAPTPAGESNAIGDPARPLVGDFFWSIAPLSDALNIGHAPLEPWLGRISQQYGPGSFALSLFHSGPPDALVRPVELFATEEAARDAYIKHLDEEVKNLTASLAVA